MVDPNGKRKRRTRSFLILIIALIILGFLASLAFPVSAQEHNSEMWQPLCARPCSRHRHRGDIPTPSRNVPRLLAVGQQGSTASAAGSHGEDLAIARFDISRRNDHENDTLSRARAVGLAAIAAPASAGSGHPDPSNPAVEILLTRLPTNEAKRALRLSVHSCRVVRLNEEAAFFERDGLFVNQ